MPTGTNSPENPFPQLGEDPSETWPIYDDGTFSPELDEYYRYLSANRVMGSNIGLTADHKWVGVLVEAEEEDGEDYWQFVINLGAIVEKPYLSALLLFLRTEYHLLTESDLEAIYTHHPDLSPVINLHNRTEPKLADPQTQVNDADYTIADQAGAFACLDPRPKEARLHYFRNLAEQREDQPTALLPLVQYDPNLGNILGLVNQQDKHFSPLIAFSKLNQEDLLAALYLQVNLKVLSEAEAGRIYQQCCEIPDPLNPGQTVSAQELKLRCANHLQELGEDIQYFYPQYTASPATLLSDIQFFIDHAIRARANGESIPLNVITAWIDDKQRLQIQIIPKDLPKTTPLTINIAYPHDLPVNLSDEWVKYFIDTYGLNLGLISIGQQSRIKQALSTVLPTNLIERREIESLIPDFLDFTQRLQNHREATTRSFGFIRASEKTYKFNPPEAGLIVHLARNPDRQYFMWCEIPESADDHDGLKLFRDAYNKLIIRQFKASGITLARTTNGRIALYLPLSTVNTNNFDQVLNSNMESFNYALEQLYKALCGWQVDQL